MAVICNAYTLHKEAGCSVLTQDVLPLTVFAIGTEKIPLAISAHGRHRGRGIPRKPRNVHFRDACGISRRYLAAAASVLSVGESNATGNSSKGESLVLLMEL